MFPFEAWHDFQNCIIPQKFHDIYKSRLTSARHRMTISGPVRRHSRDVVLLTVDRSPLTRFWHGCTFAFDFLQYLYNKHNTIGILLKWPCCRLHTARLTLDSRLSLSDAEKCNRSVDGSWPHKTNFTPPVSGARTRQSTISIKSIMNTYIEICMLKTITDMARKLKKIIQKRDHDVNIIALFLLMSSQALNEGDQCLFIPCVIFHWFMFVSENKIIVF